MAAQSLMGQAVSENLKQASTPISDLDFLTPAKSFSQISSCFTM